MKIYANTPASTLDKLVGKNLWVLAKLGKFLIPPVSSSDGKDRYRQQDFGFEHFVWISLISKSKGRYSFKMFCYDYFGNDAGDPPFYPNNWMLRTTQIAKADQIEIVQPIEVYTEEEFFSEEE